VLQEHRIEGSVLERQMQGVGDLERDAIGQSAAGRQISGRIDEAGAQVDACHLAAEGGGEIARRTADAAADVQHAGRGFETSGAGQFGGGEDASDMEWSSGAS
jgi:hypothetical protein